MKKQLTIKMVEQAIRFLQNNTEFQRYVFPSMNKQLQPCLNSRVDLTKKN